MPTDSKGLWYLLIPLGPNFAAEQAVSSSPSPNIALSPKQPQVIIAYESISQLKSCQQPGEAKKWRKARPIRAMRNVK